MTRFGLKAVRLPASLRPASLLVLLMAVIFPARALGQGLGGEYTVGPTKVKVNIHSWGDDCGPQPKSYTSKGKGKKVTVIEKGDHLVFSNGRSTNKCWSANVNLQRLSVTKKGSTWTIVCKSPASDSRQEHGKYVVNAAGSKITVKDTSNYNWKLKESVCKATIIIERVFTRSGAAVEPVEPPPVEKKPSPTPAIDKEYPEEPPPKKCKETGPPVRIAVSPSSASTTPGNKVCFSAYSVDKNGCRLHVKPEWKLVKENADRAGRMDGNCFVPGDNAADSEGTFRVIADYSYYQDGAKVLVKSQFIEDLIAINLDPAGEEMEQPAGEPGEDRVETSQGQVEVPEPGGRRIPVFLVYVLPAIVLLIALGLIIVLVVVDRRKKLRLRISELEAQRLSEAERTGPSEPAPARVPGGELDDTASRPARQRKQAQIPGTPEAAPPSEPAAPASTAGPTRVCRVCGREYAHGSRFCPQDGSALVAASIDQDEAPETGMICPRCGRGYPPGSRNCGEDGELLVPAPVADAGLDTSQSGQSRDRKLICPVCSTVYDDGSTFCGNDGNRLVPMN